MDYTVIINNRSYDLPKKTVSVMNKLDDVLKVDKEFVWSIEEKKKGKAALNCVIDFAKGQNMMVTAEGVETQAHVDFLTQAGVNNLQGYLISKPLEPKACMAFLEKYQHVDILEVIKLSVDI